MPVPVMAQDAPIEITADNALEWDRDASTFIARGNAMVIQGDTTLKAETLTADYIEKDSGLAIQKIVATGNKPSVATKTETLTADNITAFFQSAESTALDKVIATGNVVIETEKETLYGNKAEYMPMDEKAIVTGDVKIINGQNTLTGDKAEFDMKTNTSTLKSTNTGGRVKAVFFPGKK